MKCKGISLFITICLIISCLCVSCTPELSAPSPAASASPSMTAAVPATPSDSDGQWPTYTGNAYTILNQNVPAFDEADLTVTSYETYGQLDALGRCTQAMACIGLDIMPTEDRGSIGQIKPSGWHTVTYDCVDGRYLYNRCHLIGYQLTGENANAQNLMTGTRYMNTKGMLPFENLVADYVKDTENHVLYRVTPIFENNDLLAGGVQIEAMSVEDRGAGVSFNVYVFNVQPGIEIDYATGDSWLIGTDPTATPAIPTGAVVFILNTGSGKFHKPDCSSAAAIAEENRLEIQGQTRDQMIDHGYSPCKRCNP